MVVLTKRSKASTPPVSVKAPTPSIQEHRLYSDVVAGRKSTQPDAPFIIKLFPHANPVQPTTPVQSANSMESVISTTELCERFLSYLDTKELSRARSVCHHFDNVINGSLHLQQKLFLKPRIKKIIWAAPTYWRYDSEKSESGSCLRDAEPVHRMLEARLLQTLATESTLWGAWTREEGLRSIRKLAHEIYVLTGVYPELHLDRAPLETHVMAPRTLSAYFGLMEKLTYDIDVFEVHPQLTIDRSNLLSPDKIIGAMGCDLFNNLWSSSHQVGRGCFTRPTNHANTLQALPSASSLSNMYLSQPPVKEVLVDILIPGYERYYGPTCRKVHSFTMSDPNGITFGQVSAAVCSIRSRPGREFITRIYFKGGVPMTTEEKEAAAQTDGVLRGFNPMLSKCRETCCYKPGGRFDSEDVDFDNPWLLDSDSEDGFDGWSRTGNVSRECVLFDDER